MSTLQELLKHPRNQKLRIYLSSQLGVIQSDVPDKEDKQDIYFEHIANLHVAESIDIAQQMACQEALKHWPIEKGWKVCEVNLTRISPAVIGQLCSFWQAGLFDQSPEPEGGHPIGCHGQSNTITKPIETDSTA